MQDLFVNFSIYFTTEAASSGQRLRSLSVYSSESASYNKYTMNICNFTEGIRTYEGDKGMDRDIRENTVNCSVMGVKSWKE